MRSTKNDLELIVQGCKKGDRASQHRLFEQYYGLMKMICLRYAANEMEAEDLCHDGFLKVFEKIKKFKGAGSFEGWMKRIFVNMAIDMCRKKSANQLVTLEDNHLGVEDEPDEEDFTEEFFRRVGREALLESIQKLSDAYRAVFNLYVFEGYSHQEIAEQLHISVGSSKSNLAKARKNLRKTLERLMQKKNVG